MFCDEEACLTCFRPIDEWHVDLEKIVTVKRLGSYPACPDSRKRPDLRAIRPIDRGAADLSTQGFRVCYRKLYGQLVSNAPFPRGRPNRRSAATDRASVCSWAVTQA